MKALDTLLFALLMGAAEPVAGWPVTTSWAQGNDSEQPGSVLVFPKFIRGTYNDVRVSGSLVHARTELEISVVCPSGETCGQNQAVRLRAHWVCPGSSTNPICAETSFELRTTVGGTLYFNPEGVTDIAGVITAAAFPSNATTPILAPPCQRGYLIVWVVDGFNTAIKFDGLIGDAVLRDAPGAINNEFSARGYNAIPIQAADFLSTGSPTDGNMNGALDFDETEYRAITGRIFGTVRYENRLVTGIPEGPVETDLTLLTLDVASSQPNPATNVGLNFYTADEGVVDVSTSFFCWSEQRLTDIGAGLTVQSMGRKGLVESFRAQQQTPFGTVDVTLLGIIETKEFGRPPFTDVQFRDYVYSLYNDGRLLATTFRP